jgi:flagellar basal-body rod protein FlgG
LLRGIYIAASGLLAESARQDVIANNLANATTTGFKRSESTAHPFSSMLLHDMGRAGAPAIGTMEMGAEVDGIDRIDTQGALRFTGNNLDIALVGTGNFTIDTPAGRRYTRDGSFGLDEQGRLVTKEGHAVLGVAGPITLDRGEVKIARDGTITQAGTVKGKLLLTDLDPASVTTEGASLHTGTATGTSSASVRQNFLESSTVNVVTEMVDLIRVMRAFEANQKSVHAHDEALQASIQKVGAVA